MIYRPAAFCPVCNTASTPERGDREPQSMRHKPGCPASGASRFTGDDLICLSARIAAELDSVTDRPVSIAEDFNRCMREAPRAIGCQPLDLRLSEVEEMAEMVTDAIAGRSGDVPAQMPWVAR